MLDFLCMNVKPVLNAAVSSISEDINAVQRIIIVDIINDAYRKAEKGYLKPTDIMVLQQKLPNNENTKLIIGCIVERFRQTAYSKYRDYSCELERNLSLVVRARGIPDYMREHIDHDVRKVLMFAHMGKMSADNIDAIKYTYGYLFAEDHARFDIVINCLNNINDIEYAYSQVIAISSPDDNPNKWSDAV